MPVVQNRIDPRGRGRLLEIKNKEWNKQNRMETLKTFFDENDMVVKLTWMYPDKYDSTFIQFTEILTKAYASVFFSIWQTE